MTQHDMNSVSICVRYILLPVPVPSEASYLCIAFCSVAPSTKPCLLPAKMVNLKCIKYINKQIDMMMVNGETLDATTGVFLSLSLPFLSDPMHICSRPLGSLLELTDGRSSFSTNHNETNKTKQRTAFQIPKSKFPPYIHSNQM